MDIYVRCPLALRLLYGIAMQELRGRGGEALCVATERRYYALLTAVIRFCQMIKGAMGGDRGRPFAF